MTDFRHFAYTFVGVDDIPKALTALRHVDVCRDLHASDQYWAKLLYSMGMVVPESYSLQGPIDPKAAVEEFLKAALQHGDTREVVVHYAGTLGFVFELGDGTRVYLERKDDDRPSVGVKLIIDVAKTTDDEFVCLTILGALIVQMQGNPEAQAYLASIAENLAPEPNLVGCGDIDFAHA